MRRNGWLFLLPLLFATTSPAQIGGHGRDGALAPRWDVGLDTSKNGGIFEFTRIDIPAGVTVTIRGPNPAILLSQAEVKIAGRIRVDGSTGGPGGFDGGAGTRFSFTQGGDGKGPGGGKVEPKPLALELPFLVEVLPPRIGRRFGLACAAVPGDLVALFMAKRGATILTPFGILRLDPTADMIFASAIVVPTRHHDPIGTVVFPIHNDPLLNGLSLHVQGIHLVTRSLRPRLTNSVVTQIRQ